MVEPRVVQCVGGLAGVELNQPGLAVAGGMRFAEESYHHAERVAASVADGCAEKRAEPYLRGRIDERKKRPRPFNVFDEHAAVRRKKRCRKISEQLDLLRGKAGICGHLEGLARSLRQKQQHAQVSLLQGSN